MRTAQGRGFAGARCGWKPLDPLRPATAGGPRDRGLRTGTGDGALRGRSANGAPRAAPPTHRNAIATTPPWQFQMAHRHFISTHPPSGIIITTNNSACLRRPRATVQKKSLACTLDLIFLPPPTSFVGVSIGCDVSGCDFVVLRSPFRRADTFTACTLSPFLQS